MTSRWEGGVFYLLFWVMLGCSGEQAADINPMDPAPARVSSADGVEIAFTRFANGPTALVFIHGWLCDSGFWDPQVKTFQDKYTVVALDLAGHGASGTARTDWTLAAFGKDVKAVVDTLEAKPVILIGHSMGGPVALQAARLLSDRVIGVVGVDTLHNAELRWDPESFQKLMQQYRRDFPGTCGEFVDMMFTDQADPVLVRQIRAKMCDASPEIALALLQEMSIYDMKADLGALKVPIRCINSDQFSTRVDINRKYAADFDVVLMSGVGHFLMMERADEFNQRLSAILEEMIQRRRTGP